MHAPASVFEIRSRSLGRPSSRNRRPAASSSSRAFQIRQVLNSTGWTIVSSICGTDGACDVTTVVGDRDGAGGAAVGVPPMLLIASLSVRGARDACMLLIASLSLSVRST